MNAKPHNCPQCDVGPEHLLDDPDHGQLVCAACGVVLGDSLLYAGGDHGVYQDPQTGSLAGPSTVARIHHLQGALRDSLRPAPDQAQNEGSTLVVSSSHRSRQAKCMLALQDLDSYAQLLNMPDENRPELHRLFLYVMRRGRFQWGSAAGLVAAACLVLLSRKLNAPIPLRTASVKLHLDISTLGRYLGFTRLLAAHHYIARELGDPDDLHADDSNATIDVNDYVHIPAIAAILSPGSSQEQLMSLAHAMLDGMVLPAPPDPSALLQAWQQAAARGDVTALRHFCSIDTTNGNHTRARLFLPTIIRIVSPVFESRRPQACALAIACIAREAQEATPCSAAVWAALLGSCNPGTALLNQRDAVDTIVLAAKRLPWFQEIKTRGSERNVHHFMGQVLELVDLGVLQADGVETPSFLRGKKDRDQVESRIQRAMSKLKRLGAVIEPADVYLEECDDSDGGNDCDVAAGHHSPACGNQNLVVTDVDVAIEFLLVHGSIPVSQLRNMTSRDILVAADLAAHNHQRELYDLDASDLVEQDLSAAEQQLYLPYIGAAQQSDDPNGLPEQLVARAHVFEAIARQPM